VKFYLDENLPPAIAETLRRRGIDAVSAHEIGKVRIEDTVQLALAAREGRCLVSRDVRDFTKLGRDAVDAKAPHAGIVLCPARVRDDEIAFVADTLARIAKRYPDGPGEYAVIYL